jgi:hypothetical protein
MVKNKCSTGFVATGHLENTNFTLYFLVSTLFYQCYFILPILLAEFLFYGDFTKLAQITLALYLGSAIVLFMIR